MRSGVAYNPVSDLAVWSSTDAWSSDYPIAQLANLREIRRVALATTASARVSKFVLPAAVIVQLVSLVHHNAPYGATFRLRLFSNNNPDPVGNAGAIVYDSGASTSIWPENPGKLYNPATRPIVLDSPVVARSGWLQLDSRLGLDSKAWELGGVDIAQFWEWDDVTVPTENGFQNTDAVQNMPDSMRAATAQWAPRIWNGTRSLVDQSEAETIALDFQADRGLTKPFTFVWDADDPATWARQCFLARNARLLPPKSTSPSSARTAVNLVEHL